MYRMHLEGFKGKLLSPAVVLAIFLALGPFTAEGQLTTPPGVHIPGNVRWNETSPTYYSSYMDFPFCLSKAAIHQPSTVEEVIDIVRHAARDGIHVKAVGARHSLTDIICTDGIPLDMRRLKKAVLNSDNSATFGPGVTLREATAFLRRHKRALRTIPGYGNITIGGMLGTGAHGSSIKYTSSVSSQVIDMTIVDGTGEIRHITLEEELQAFRVHLGLLGVVIEARLKTVPLYKTKAFNYILHETALSDGRVQDLARNSDQVSIYWFPSTRRVVVAKWTIVDVTVPGNAFTNDHVPSTYKVFNDATASLGELIFDWMDSSSNALSFIGHSMYKLGEYYMQYSLLRKMPLMVPIYTVDNLKLANPAVGYYDEMFAPICHEAPTPDELACPWAHGDPSINLNFIDNEVAFDIKHLPKVVLMIKDVMKQTPTTFPLFGILLRFSGNSSTYMSNSYGRDVVHLEWYAWLRNRGRDHPPACLAGYQTIMQTLFKRFGGRSHWGKSGMAFHSREVLKESLDSRAATKFLEMMTKYDPKGVFTNSFGERLKGSNTEIDVSPFVRRCALMDNCICGSESDCGPHQVCSSVRGYDSTKVCMREGDKSKGFQLQPYVNLPDFKEDEELIKGFEEALSSFF